MAGVAVASMRHSLVLVDRNGHVIFACPNKDGRSAGEASELAMRSGELLIARTGHFPMPIMSAARLLWLKNNQPGLLEKAGLMLSASAWMAYELSGQAVDDPTQAGESNLFDLGARRWASDLVTQLDLPSRLLPPVMEPGSRLGMLTPAAASLFGLPAGIPVGVGGGDTQLALLGMGTLQPGDLGILAGSTAPVMLVTAAASPEAAPDP